jgi:hypothetical protein
MSQAIMDGALAQGVMQRYDAAFGNLDEIALPQLLLDERFISLLEVALARNSAVTPKELEEEFPDAQWEGVQ